MSHTEQDLWRRLDDAERMPYGMARIGVVEEVLRHADAQSLADLQFAARLSATTAYTYGGERAKAFTTFAWCLAASDRGDAPAGHEHDLHWQFKWMVTGLTEFPDIPLDRTYAVLDDMERRYRAAGYTMNPVHQHRVVVARHVGDRAVAEEQYRLWNAAPRGAMSDCAGCEPTTKVRHLAWSGRDEDAVAVALPVLDGTLNCHVQPEAVLTALLLPYLRTGRLTEAVNAHRRAYRAIQSTPAKVTMLGTHLVFCARSGNHARGLELLERHLGWLASAPSPGADLRFASGAALVLRQVVAAGHGETPVRRPALDGTPATVVPAAVLHDELAARARALAARFDARNGTPAVGENIAAILTAEPIVDQLPLSGLARHTARQHTPATPAPPALPDSPAELVALARAAATRGDADAQAAAWRRFDEVCPDPEPALLAPRTYARAVEVVDTDPIEAERLMLRAGELYEAVGDQARLTGLRGQLAMLWCQTDRVEEGVAAAEASAAELMTIGTADERAAGQLRLGRAYEAAERWADCQAALARAGELAESATLVGDAEFALAQLAAAEGDRLPVALEHATRAVAAFAAEPGIGGLPHARMFAGRLHAALGEFAAARPLLAAAAETADPALRGEVLALHGHVALDMGLEEEACDLLASAVATLRAAGEPAAAVTVDYADAALRVDRAHDAADALAEALPELDGPQGNHARFLLAKAYRSLGQYEGALALCAEVGRFCAADGNPAGEGQMHAMSGSILDELDRDDEAAEWFTAAADSFAEGGVPVEALANRRRAAVSWWWCDEVDECLAALAAAAKLAAEIPDDAPAVTWQKALLSYDTARVFASVDRESEALDHAVAAAAGFRAVESMEEAAAVTVLRGRLLATLNRHDEARTVLTEVLPDLPDDTREEVTALLATLDD